MMTEKLVENLLLLVVEKGVEWVIERLLGEVTEDEAQRITRVLIRRVGIELVKNELDREAQIRLIEIGLDEAERSKFGPEEKTSK